MKYKKQINYHQLIDDLNDAVYTVSFDNNLFTSVNKSGEMLTGYSRDALLKKSFTEVVAPEYLRKVKKMILHKAKRPERSTIYDIEIIRKDGSRVPVEISSRVLYKDGKPSEIIGIARDVSERKHHEQQKEIFTSIITHEIKNPLTSMQIYTELLQKKLAKQKTITPYLESIHGQIHTLSQLMNDFLEINQLQLGKFNIAKEEFDFDMQLGEIIKIFAKQHITHTIVYEGNQIGKITADKNRIRQVLWNLIANAIKYSPTADEVIISVSKIQKHINVAIRDFGAGISKREQKHIFNPFYRTIYAQQSQIKGHGLGLYICQQIIKGHRGKIWVKSKEGEGSTFFFSVPHTDRPR